MKILIFCGCLFLIEIGFSQNEGRLLEDAYKKNSTLKLKTFFDSWQKDVPTISDNELVKLNDTLQNAYKVFKAFYNPLDIDKMGGSEWKNDIYKKAYYLIVQNKIKIYLTGDKIYYSDQEIDDYVVAKINSEVKNDSLKQSLLKRINGKFPIFILSA